MFENQAASVGVSALRGDPAKFGEALGLDADAGSGAWFCGFLRVPAMGDRAALLRAVADYGAGVVVELEWPVIVRAHAALSEGRWKDLVALDRALSADARLQPFREASSHVGRAQLRRMRPVRACRALLRYREAVEAGEAAGWHTVVYGLVLGVYSLPLVPGLIHYSRQSYRGLLWGQAWRFEWQGADVEREAEALVSSLVRSVPWEKAGLQPMALPA